jgi:hypothetical protein
MLVVVTVECIALRWDELVSVGLFGGLTADPGGGLLPLGVGTAVLLPVLLAGWPTSSKATWFLGLFGAALLSFFLLYLYSVVMGRDWNGLVLVEAVALVVLTGLFLPVQIFILQKRIREAGASGMVACLVAGAATVATGGGLPELLLWVAIFLGASALLLLGSSRPGGKLTRDTTSG